jgi:hypothetical protein
MAQNLYSIDNMKIKNLFLLALACTSVSNCTWIWEKSKALGDHMPVYDSNKRCTDGVYCSSRDYETKGQR